MENLFSEYLENTSGKSTPGIPATRQKEFDALRNLYHDIRKPEETDTDKEMDNAVLALIEKEKCALISESNLKSLEKTFSEEIRPEIRILPPSKKNNFLFGTTFWKYAAGLVILGGIFWLGRWTAEGNLASLRELAALKKDVQETRQLVMLEMMKRESASERIQAVNYSFEIDNPDKEVLEALIRTLNSDSNTNVRTAAAEALSHFGHKKIARDALIQALNSQKDPTLQIVIIDILAHLGDKRAVTPIRQLLQNSTTEDFVKRKAKESMEILKTI